MLHLIKRSGQTHAKGDAQGNGRFAPGAPAFGPALGLVLALALGLVPAPFPAPLPNLLPRLNAQAYPNRLRRPPDYPAGAPPTPAPQSPQTTSPAAPTTPQAAPSAPAASPGAPGAFLPPSMLDQPAEPAKIQFAANNLSIHADNSSLGEILHDISTKSGMQLQGFNSDERVFGSFGPGTPREVLTDLLNGTPYNLVMVGDLANGAPRQLILTPSTPGGAAQPSPTPASSEDNDNSDDAPPPAPPEPGQRREVAPGMNPQTVRTPQQMLQELQQMRQQQQQGQQPQPQNQQPQQ